MKISMIRFLAALFTNLHKGYVNIYLYKHSKMLCGSTTSVCITKGAKSIWQNKSRQSQAIQRKAASNHFVENRKRKPIIEQVASKLCKSTGKVNDWTQRNNCTIETVLSSWCGSFFYYISPFSLTLVRTIFTYFRFLIVFNSAILVYYSNFDYLMVNGYIIYTYMYNIALNTQIILCVSLSVFPVWTWLIYVELHICSTTINVVLSVRTTPKKNNEPEKKK